MHYIMGTQLSNQFDTESSSESVTTQNIKESDNVTFQLTKETVNKLVEEGSVKHYDTLPSNDDVKLYSFVKCNNESNNVIKRCRGVVFNKDELVVQSLPYSDEIECSSEDLLRQYFDKYNMSDIPFFHSKEGTLLRLYYLEDRWHLSTIKKLDSFQSFWNSSISFGDLFKIGITEEMYKNNDFNKMITDMYNEDNHKTPIIETKNDNFVYNTDGVYNVFLDTLDKNEQYMFLVSTTSHTRIVCNYGDIPQIYFVGKYTDDNKLSTANNTCIKMSTLRCFTSVDELTSYVDSMDTTVDQGVIGYLPDHTQVKVLNDLYKSLYDLRGNQPSVKFRYLQLINDTDKLRTFRNLYPEHHNTFNDIDHILYNISIGIYTQYCRRFIHKQYAVVPKEQYGVLKQCHEWHCQDRQRHKISIEKVIDLVYSQPAVCLNKMIKLYPNYIQNSPRSPDQSYVQARI